MTEFLTYDLKVAALIAVFYMFYRLLLAKETFHRLNRLVLLATAVGSFVLPLCVITIHHKAVIPLTDSPMPVAAAITDGAQTDAKAHIATLVFVLGMVVTLGVTLTSLTRVILLIRRGEKHPQPDGTVIVVTDRDLMPFSWMKWIVLNRSDYAESNAAILAHERAHIAFHHSCDLLLADTLTALQWFNPAVWMLRADLRAIHEFEADAAVLSHGINARQYQYLLIKKAVAGSGYTIANGFSHSTLKNRIQMMLHQPSHRISYLKLIALLPIVGAALALNAREVTDVVYAPVATAAAAPTAKAAVEKVDKALPATTTTAAAPPQMEEQQRVEADKNTTFTGKIVDKKGNPVVGAIVQIAGTPKGVVTDTKGQFSISAPKGSTIVVKYIGMKSVQMQAKENMAISLESDDSEMQPLDEPTKTKETKPQTTTLSEVLIILDGKEISKAEMDKLNPGSIKSITVLKDKSATELYGDRGAKGVIVITSK